MCQHLHCLFKTVKKAAPLRWCSLWSPSCTSLLQMACRSTSSFFSFPSVRFPPYIMSCAGLRSTEINKNEINGTTAGSSVPCMASYQQQPTCLRAWYCLANIVTDEIRCVKASWISKARRVYLHIVSMRWQWIYRLFENERKYVSGS